MRRLRRILLNAATTLSFTLFLLVSTCWVRSAFVADHWSLDRGASGIGYTIAVHSGGLNLSKSRWTSVAKSLRAGWSHFAIARDDLPEDYRYFRVWTWFRFEIGDGGWDHHFLFVRVPFWFLFLSTALLPSMSLRGYLKRRRRTTTGTCPVCGYDLRATPDRCPECGHRPSP